MLRQRWDQLVQCHSAVGRHDLDGDALWDYDLDLPCGHSRHRSISLASQVAPVRSSQTFPVEAVTSVSEANCQPAPRRSFPMPTSSFTGRDTRREAGVRRTKRQPHGRPGRRVVAAKLAPDWLRTVRAKWHRCRPGHGGERRPPTAPHRRRAQATHAPGTAQPRRRPLLIVTVQLSLRPRGTTTSVPISQSRRSLSPERPWCVGHLSVRARL